MAKRGAEYQPIYGSMVWYVTENLQLLVHPRGCCTQAGLGTQIAQMVSVRNSLVHPRHARARGNP